MEFNQDPAMMAHGCHGVFAAPVLVNIVPLSFRVADVGLSHLNLARRFQEKSSIAERSIFVTLQQIFLKTSEKVKEKNILP